VDLGEHHRVPAPFLGDQDEDTPAVYTLAIYAPFFVNIGSEWAVILLLRPREAIQ
jgi:hypothetical protein